MNTQEYGGKFGDMVNLARMQQQLIAHEGLKLKAYKCPAGRTTVGVGRNLDDTGITHEEAMLLLANDVGRCIKELSESLPWWTSLGEIRRRVLIDMVFNMGIHGFLKFKETIGHIQYSQFNDAAAEMLKSSWAKQVGKRAVRLANMMETGQEVAHE